MYLDVCIDGVQDFIPNNSIFNIFITYYTYFKPVVKKVMTNISLPAEAIYRQEFGDSRILTVCKQLRYSNFCAPITHYDWNRFNLVITSCNANDLVSKFSTRLKKKKKRKHLLLLTLWSFVFFYCILQNNKTMALFLPGTK